MNSSFPVKANNYDSVKILIEKGADVNAKDNKGLTPLMYAAEYDTKGTIINLLLENGADFNAKDNDGKTALEYASNNPNHDIKKLLPNYDENSEKPEDDEPIFILPERMPEFPGGQRLLILYISEHIKYPEQAVKQGIEGTVYLRFVVKKDGSVGEVQVTKGVDPLLDQEAVRVIKSLPKFKPGYQGGRPVNVWYSLPLVFKLSD